MCFNVCVQMGKQSGKKIKRQVPVNKKKGLDIDCQDFDVNFDVNFDMRIKQLGAKKKKTRCIDK